MPGFGCYNGFPLVLGGGQSVLEQEHLALLDALTPGWDADESTIHWAETYAAAQAITMIWACNARLKNQAVPQRMLENLTTWEEALSLAPDPRDNDIERRKRVAARLRGYANNSLGDISDACATVMGDNFVEIVTVPSASQITYWPGVFPGPPGLEWSSNRCRLGISVTRDGLGDEEYESKVSALVAMLDGLTPAWMAFTIGIGAPFVVDLGVLDETVLS